MAAGGRRAAGARTGFTSRLVTGDGWLVWYTVSSGRIPGLLDVWATPVAGGQVHRVASIRPTTKSGDLDALEVADGEVVWSRERKGGVYRVPVLGGTPRLVPRSAGYHLLTWHGQARRTSRASSTC